MLGETPHRILVVRKVATTLRKSVFQLMRDYIIKYGLSSKFKVRTGDQTIECINGNQMYFLGLDDVEKLKSIEGITSIWIEEASEVSEDDFTQLDLRLRGHTTNYQQIILSFNPISETHWLKRVFFDKNKPDTTILKTTYLNNSFIDERYKQVLNDLKDSNERMYNIYALGDWGALKGLVFKPYTEIPFIPVDVDLEWSYGVDFGYSAPSSCVKVGYDKVNHALYFDEILYQSELTKGELIRSLNIKAPELKGMLGFGDSAEPDAVVEFVRAGYKMRGSIKATNMSIDFINSNKVYITKRSGNLKREWNGYKWKVDKEGNIIDVVVKADDHAIDSARYGAYSKWGVKIDSKGVVTDKIRSSIKQFGGY